MKLAEKIINERKQAIPNVMTDVENAVKEIFEVERVNSFEIWFYSKDDVCCHIEKKAHSRNLLEVPIAYMHEILKYLNQQGFCLFRNTHCNDTFVASLYDVNPNCLNWSCYFV